MIIPEEQIFELDAGELSLANTKNSSNANSCCLALGDADNDGDIELVVADTRGYLYIFKYLSNNSNSNSDNDKSKPFVCGANLGTLTALAVGAVKVDANKVKTNAIIAVNAEGSCHVFIMKPPSSKSGNLDYDRLIPTFTLPVPVNVCRIYLDGISDDGEHARLVLGRTDRYILIYQLKLTANPSSGEDEASLTLLHRYQCEAQVGTIVKVKSIPSNLAIAQPNGNFMTMDLNSYKISGFSFQDNEAVEAFSSLEAPGEIISGVFINNNEEEECLAVCTLDGYFKFHNVNSPETTINVFKTQVHHQFFAISKISVNWHNPTTTNGDENDDKYIGKMKTFVVAFAWDGLTCLVDCDTMKVYKFPFPDRVCACIGGNFSIAKGNVQPCLFFIDFYNQIHVFYGLTENNFELDNQSIFERIIEDLKKHKNIFDMNLDDPNNAALLESARKQFKETFHFT